MNPCQNTIPVTKKTEQMWENIPFSNMKCTQSDGRIQGLFIQGLVSHIRERGSVSIVGMVMEILNLP